MKTFIKVLKVLFISILVILLIFNITIMIKSAVNPDKVPSVFGYKPFVVTSGSMETKLSVGDLVFVKNVTSDDIKVNDIIAFRDSENYVVTHRIIEEVDLDGSVCYKTKGDNNNTEDDMAVCPDRIEGKYVSKISKVGYAIIFIQEPTGFIIMMLIILIIGMFIYFGTGKKKNELSEEELKEFEEFKKSRRKKQKVNKK